MSNFKKMRIVNNDEKIESFRNDFDISNINRHRTPTNLRRINDLDQEIDEILNSSIDESRKAKLYSQALRKYLTFKELYREEEAKLRNQDIQKLIDLRQPQTLTKIVMRKPTTPKGKIKKPIPYAPKKIKKTGKTNLKVVKSSNKSQTNKEIQAASTSTQKNIQPIKISKSKKIIKQKPKSKLENQNIIDISSDDSIDPWSNYV